MIIRILLATYLLAFCGLTLTAANDENPDSSPRSAMMPTSEAISLFKQRVTRFDKDHSSRLVLGQLYIRSAKEDDKFHDLCVAEEQFRQVLEAEPKNSSAMILLSYSLLSQHRFEEAYQWSEKYLDEKPNDRSALAIRFDAEMQLGRYGQAKNTIDRLVKLGQAPHCLVRLASYYETFGETEKSLSAMRQACEEQMLLGDTAENNAWFALRFAQLLFDAGVIDEANNQTGIALKQKENYPQALALLARIQWAKGLNQEAIDSYKQSILLSEEPPVLAKLGDLLMSVNRVKEAQGYFQKAEQMMLEEEKDPIAGPPHARERAIYFSNHNQRLDHAVKLASGDLKVRSDIHSQDVMAWSLHQAGRSKAALAHAREAMRTRTRSATILFHSGMIEIANGNEETGRAHLADALKSNPFFSETYAQQIRGILNREK